MGTDFGSKMELIYFPVSGRALTSRLLLKSKGVNFTDTQISFADWATSGIKDSKFKIPELPRCRDLKFKVIKTL